MISRAQALHQGFKRYFTGIPCARNHISERLVSSRACLQCHADDMFIRRSNDLEHARKIDKKSRDKAPARGRKCDLTEQQWKDSLDYFRVKNQERRDYSIGELSPEIRVILFERQEGICNGCSCLLDDSAHLDHIIPLSRGGLNIDANTQLLCAPCNLSKGSKLMEEWKC